MDKLANQFEQFLNEEMTVEEYASFKEKMESDEELLGKFQDYVLTKKIRRLALQQNATQRAKEAVDKFNLETKKAAQRKKWLIFAVLLLALIVAILIFALNFNRKDANNPRPINATEMPAIAQAEYLDNQKIKNALVQPFSNLSGGNASINQIVDNLNRQEYDAVIAEINLVSADESNFNRLQLIKGYSYLQEGEYLQARAIFAASKNSIQDNIYLKEEAEWLEILTYILSPTPNNNALKNLLIAVKDTPNHKYQTNAKSFYDAFD